MKISVITMHNFPNYGSFLQAFATQEKLREYSSDVEIIDYAGGNNTIRRSMKNYVSLGFNTNPIKALINLPIRLRKRSVYTGFAKEYLNLSADQYITEEDLKRYPFHDGFYCTGSDQVWNPFYEENMPYFLNFLPEDHRRFGYAASFGNYIEECLSSADVDKLKEYVIKYKHISVREARALTFMREHFGFQDAVQLVDPTLAMPPEFWRRFALKPKIRKEYILVYKLGKEESFERFAKEISKQTGLPIIRLCCQSFKQLVFHIGIKVILPPVFQFITLIDNAKYVITDSFHGAAFSMNLNTELFVYREEYDGDRISDFLRLIGQEQRYITNSDDIHTINSPVNFEHVNSVLTYERERVNTYLCGVLGESKL